MSSEYSIAERRSGVTVRRCKTSVTTPLAMYRAQRHQTLLQLRGGQRMYVMMISTISDNEQFWGALKKAYGQLPTGAEWTLAVGSTDGTKAVNGIVHNSIE